MTKDVSTTSIDYDAMAPYWRKVDAILGGADSMRKAKTYLPQFPNETDKDYGFRLKNAKFTNVFRDIAENLASKPFAEELKVKDDAPDQIKLLAENIDGQGNHLHVFGAECFFRGLTHAVHWIFVDYPQNAAGKVRSIADEKAAALRPYWISIPATDVLAAEKAKVGGVYVWTHFRFRANTTIREGYEEKTVERIREYNRDVATGVVSFKVWEKQAEKNQVVKKWVVVDEGTITLKEIPCVPFFSGRGKGGTFNVEPMLQDAADLQVELFQQESGLKYAKENTAFPMLAGNGVAPAMGEDGKTLPVPVGPKTVLYAPPNGDNQHGEWTFIEPTAESLRFLAEDVKETITQLRELGRQPLTAETGNLTTVMAAQSAAKGNSAVMAAALMFKDAVENAFRITGAWMNDKTEIEVEIFTDFDVELQNDNGPQTLTDARTNGDLSQRTYWSELQRRRILGPNFDAEEEEELLMNETPDDSEQAVIDALPPVPRAVA